MLLYNMRFNQAKLYLTVINGIIQSVGSHIIFFEKADFDQRLKWAAPKCWSKYTTAHN